MPIETTPNLNLPFIMAAQAQKHVTHNEAIRALDAIVHLSVLDNALTSPPPTPAEGDRYLVAAGASGDWAGHAGEVAAFQDGGWMFYAPREGWIAWVVTAGALLVYDGASWVSAGAAALAHIDRIGVNASAGTTNRLAVKSDAVLFSHDDVTPGTGDVRQVLNKQAPAKTASQVFQSNWSGRAEIGLAGDDDLHVKVSADGSIWREAIVVDATTGVVSLPSTPLAAPNLLVNGDFQVNQRGFAGGTLAANAYGHDRWKALGGAASLSLAGFVVTLASGTIAQVVEPALWGLDGFASDTVTVSVENPSADMTVWFGSASATLAAGSGRRSVRLTLAPADTGNLTLRLAAVTGSVSFGRVKLEMGSQPTPWVARDAGAEVALCQRYFCKSMRMATVPGNGVATTTDGISTTGGATATTVVASPYIPFPCRMRATPTITFYKATQGATNGVWAYFTTAWVSFTSMSTACLTETGYVATGTTATAVFTLHSDYALAGAWAANSEL